MSLLITDLPREILEQIFGFISHKKDRHNLALICQKFYSVVRQQSKKHQQLRISRREFTPDLFTGCETFPFQKVSLSGEDLTRLQDLWIDHGSEIRQLCIYTPLNISTLSTLFPHLETLELRSFPGSNELDEINGNFPNSLNYIIISLNPEQIEKVDSFLKRIPGLKQLEFDFQTNEPLTGEAAQKFRDFLNKWLLKVDQIELKIDSYEHNFSLLQAFDESLSSEKLIFKELEIRFYRERLNALKVFFSKPKRIKTLNSFGRTFDPDVNLFAIMEENAKIDRLRVHHKRVWQKQLQPLYNLTEVKEIEINDVNSSIRGVKFSTEALLKVKGIEGWDTDSDVGFDDIDFYIPQFRNLRRLEIWSFKIDNYQLQFIINTCPHLEYMKISRLTASFQRNYGSSFSNLRNLEHLFIFDAPNLTDDCLKRGFKLTNLRALSIGSRYGSAPKVTLAGVKSLVLNCPKIEDISFEGCREINEECIFAMVKSLFYLEKITVEGCGKISSEAKANLRKMYPKLELSVK